MGHNHFMKQQSKPSVPLAYSFITDLMRLLCSEDWREANIEAISYLLSQINKVEITFKEKKQLAEQNWIKRTLKAHSGQVTTQGNCMTFFVSN